MSTSAHSEIWVELMKDSDRATAVLGFAWIEDSLEELLSLSIVPPNNRQTRDHLFGPLGPFNTTYAKTEILFRFGLLPQIIYEDLNVLRQIRNQFGHSAAPGMRFDSPGIRDKTSLLRLSETLVNSIEALGDDVAWEKKMLGSPRDRFILTVGHMREQLLKIANSRSRANVPAPSTTLA